MEYNLKMTVSWNWGLWDFENGEPFWQREHVQNMFVVWQVGYGMIQKLAKTSEDWLSQLNWPYYPWLCSQSPLSSLVLGHRSCIIGCWDGMYVDEQMSHQIAKMIELMDFGVRHQILS